MAMVMPLGEVSSSSDIVHSVSLVNENMGSPPPVRLFTLLRKP